MAKALSVDLRRRVVDAVKGGMSRRQAALRFGVSASSAIRWTAQAEETGDVTPRRQGGDRRSKHVEAHAVFLLDAVKETPDLTLAEIKARLEEARGARFGIGTLWRFFARHAITFKKSPRTQPSRTVPTS
jgi:transposase